MTEAEGLKIWLLGAFRVAVGTRAIPESAWRWRKARSLVKLLALSPGYRLHREQMIDALWPSLDPTAAANNLHQILHFARSTLQPDRPQRRTPDFLRLENDLITLGLAPHVWVDCDAFVRAGTQARQSRSTKDHQRALDLYSGDLLPDDLYEDWTVRPRQELQQLYHTLLLELARLYQQQGDSKSAQTALEHLIADDPADEEAHVDLMRLYATSGAPGHAARQYERLRDALKREVGAEPTESSTRLYQEILAGRYPREPLSEPRADLNDKPTTGRKMRPRREPVTEAPAQPARTNLPEALTSFIGRERERAELKALLSRERLVTLTGIGGVGKTRLALEVARSEQTDFRDGIWLVELASLSDASLLPHTVASALNVKEKHGRPVLESLIESLTRKTLLLVLDNCEHVRAACGQLANALLKACASVRILATSRERLNVAGEVVWRVPSLAVPALEHLPPPEQLSEFEAVQLFVTRAATVMPSFALADQNAQAIAQICYHLDGLPLAVELAASRINLLSPAQIAARLGDRFRLLKSQSPSIAPRHQTLRAALDWSYGLLSESQQKFFRTLSVFAGGFTLDAAGAVCKRDCVDEFDVLDMLAHLVDKSLVVPEEDQEEMRYRLLETVRQYGQERLQESGDATLAQQQHRDFFLALAEHAEPHLTGQGQTPWLRRLEREHDNLRAALMWSLTQKEVEPGVRLAASLWRFWYIRVYWSEGRHWLEAALSADGTAGTRLQAKALYGAGTLASEQGDFQSAATLLEKSRSLFRQLGDTRGLALAVTGFGVLASRQGNFESARSYHEESLGLARQLGDELLINLGVNNLGALALILEDYASARPPLEESINLARRRGDKWILATSLWNLGLIASRQEDHDSARALYSEALTLKWEIGDKRGVAECFEGLADVERAGGRAERAARLLGAAEGLREAIDAPLHQGYKPHYLRILDSVRAALTRDVFAAEWTRGKAMSLEEAFRYALAPAPA